MFYVIDYVRGESTAGKRLIRACKERGIEWKRIDQNLFDPDEYMFSSEDSCYRTSTTKKAYRIEQYMRKYGVKFTAEKGRKNRSVFETEERYRELGVRGIRTEYFPSKKEVLLEKQVEKLGGFPVILKESGKSEGEGVVKVDSMSSLLSVLHRMLSTSRGRVVMKEYIAHDEQARIVVLGQKVVGQKANIKQGKEIRLNADVDKFTEEKRDYPAEIKQLAINATKAQGVGFAGVDILIDEKGKGYVAEVNSPCAFTYTENVAGVDIAEKIVEYLTGVTK